MTYHRDPSKRWKDDGTVSTVGRGQEFVATPQNKGSAAEWIAALLNETLE